MPLDFNTFCERNLSELLPSIEVERKKVARFGIIGYALSAVAILFVIIAQVSHTSGYVFGAFIIAIPAIIVFIIFYFKKGAYTERFKEKIVLNIIKFIDPELRYDPDNCISEDDYTDSGLFLQKPDRYNGDDYVEGCRDKTTFRFSELHTEYETGSGKNKEWVTIFKGLFFIGDFNKNFKGRTYVYSEMNPQLGFFSRLFNSFAGDLEKVKLESLEFEDKFIVYSNDQVEARYILTPSLMERLVKLQDMMGDKTSYSFVNSGIYIAVPFDKDLFEPSVFYKNNYLNFVDYYDTIHVVFNIIDELNLNLRIWTKE